MDDETLKRYMVQLRHGERYNKSKTSRSKCNTTLKSNDPPIATKPSNELHIRFGHIKKVYTDDTGRFTGRLCSGNQYTMIAYHCDSKAIIAAPFKYHANKHRLLAYNAIIQQLKERSMLVDLQIF